MMEKCFDEGTIQAFLDGELASGLAEKVACHVALCNDCATALATAEEENSFAFAALDSQFNALVPTERIRTRLFETISAEKRTFWEKIFGKGFRWSNSHVAAFASLVFVVSAFAVLFSVRENVPAGNDLAMQNPPPPSISVAQVAPQPVSNPAPEPGIETGESTEAQPVPVIQPAVYQPRNNARIQAQRADFRPGTATVINRTPAPDVETPRPSNDYAIAGEETYVRTIATLTKTVNDRKDEIMRPSAQVAFEKDLAVVDDAIRKMRAEVRKNPKNEAAKEVLRSSYRNKIDLLNSVAEKNELMASLD